MNNEMPEEIYVFPDTEGEKDDFWAKPVAPEYDYGFKDQTRYIRADKAAPVERIGELDELREALAQYGHIADGEDSRLSSSEEWYPVNEFKMRSIVRAARTYLKLQGGE